MKVRTFSASVLRISVVLLLVAGVFAFLYFLWSPGIAVTDGRFDLKRNGIWIQHGWLGDDEWFNENKRDKSKFRDADKIKALAKKLAEHNIMYVFPHLCPVDENGFIPKTDMDQTRLFLNEMRDFKILPWVGGIYIENEFPGSSVRRKNFIESVKKLLNDYPQFAGIHVNVEPMPSSEDKFILLLKELKNSMPKGKILSVAAYPPPTIWHRFPDVHWTMEYYSEVAANSDQMVVMMYDTAIQNPKLYQWLISEWTKEIIAWSGDKKVLLGVPAYSDAWSGYHNPDIENITNSVYGINSALLKHEKLPASYEGISIYSECEMRDEDWSCLKKNFLRL